jgi:RNA polymerase sigma-70 factor, ECF subfamily
METRVRSAAPETQLARSLMRSANGAYDAPDETRMIAVILEGQTHVYHDLVRRYERAVYRMAFLILKNEADAEYAAQQAFVNAYRSLKSFRGQLRFSTWVINIASCEADEHLRQRQVAV